MFRTVAHNRSEQIQIRVTQREKVALRRLARAAGQGVSAYVLARVLPAAPGRLAALVAEMRDGTDRTFALAELNDWLTELAPLEFAAATRAADLRGLPPWVQNYVAAMIEHAAQVKAVAPPSWTSDVAPLELPYFATPLRSLRQYLLQVTPAAFRRRNIFTEGGIGGRV